MTRGERGMLIAGTLLLLFMLASLLALGSAMQNSARFGDL